jgi:hypothetical protein
MDVEGVLAQLDAVEKAMKTREFEAGLNDRELNASFAILITEALQGYLRGHVEEALESLTVFVEELGMRRSST